MDSNHKLDAPDNESLSGIDQVGDHSGLSTIYRRAKDGWSGELVTDTERERRRQEKFDKISFGIRKQFVAVALLIPYPFVLGTILLAAAFTFVTEQNAGTLAIPAIFVFLFWIITSVMSYKKLFAMFYANALQAGPFIITLLVVLGLFATIIHVLTAAIHEQQGLFSSVIVGVSELLISLVITLPLLILWTTPRLSGNARVGIIGIFVLILGGVNAYLLLS